MRDKYYPPTYDAGEFHCIHCGVYAGQRWINTFWQKYVATQEFTGIKLCICGHCKNQSFWYGSRMVVPSASTAEPPHPDLPSDCLPEYEEARSVVSPSPRAAAALLRLCLQKLLPHLGKAGKNIK